MKDNRTLTDLIRKGRPVEIIAINKGCEIRSALQQIQNKASNINKTYFVALYEL